jgi:hypothetical protein
MANALYPKWKEKLLQGTAAALLNGSGSTGVYACLYDVGAGGAYDSADEFFSAVVAGQVGTEIELSAGKSYTNGVFDSSTDPTFTSVTGAQCEAIIIFVKTASANTTWPVVAYLDTNITNLPVTPNGGNISVTWNASGIFGL